MSVLMVFELLSVLVSLVVGTLTEHRQFNNVIYLQGRLKGKQGQLSSPRHTATVSGCPLRSSLFQSSYSPEGVENT